MKIDIGDIFVFLGLLLILWGLYAFDWRLAVIAAGLVFMAGGALRLKLARENEH